MSSRHVVKNLQPAQQTTHMQPRSGAAGSVNRKWQRTAGGEGAGLDDTVEINHLQRLGKSICSEPATSKQSSQNPIDMNETESLTCLGRRKLAQVIDAQRCAV